MLTIKMNDGRTEYDVEDNYKWVRHLMQQGDKFIELKEHNYGQVLININNILSVREMCLVPVLSGCSYFENAEIQLKQSTVGLPLQISTYDFNGQKIDQINASTANIHTDSKMSEKTDGKENSSVIDIDYGSNRTIHVGSTLIAYEGIKNYADVYNHKHTKIDATQDKSIPFVTNIYKDFQNTWGKGYNGTVVFVKSQSGVPIGAFYGKKVSVHKSDIKNATNFVVDGHRLFCYRCEYTTYSLSSLKKMGE